MKHRVNNSSRHILKSHNNQSVYKDHQRKTIRNKMNKLMKEISNTG